MPREIGFRAWHKWEEKMYEVASLDFFWGIADLQWWTPSEEGELHHTKIVQFADTETSYKDVEIMQYTGLKDKHDKEIYEGDIVKCTELRNDKINEWVSEVYWEEACFWTHESKTCDVPLDLFFEGIDKRPLTEIEVIGNIHENPELLGG